MSWLLVDFACTSCGAGWESLERRSDCAPTAPCPCGGVAERLISGTHTGTVWGGAATKGPSDAPPPGAMDTRPLADGQGYWDWRERNRGARRDEVRKACGIESKAFSYSRE